MYFVNKTIGKMNDFLNIKRFLSVKAFKLTKENVLLENENRQLRKLLTQVTKERDELNEDLSIATQKVCDMHEWVKRFLATKTSDEIVAQNA